MSIAYLILLAIILCSVRFVRSYEGDSFVDGERCLPIKGICIALVFLGHAGGYLYKPGGEGLVGLERLFYFLNDNFGQLKVVPFLFFSGYGVALSLEAKGTAYLDRMPRCRMLRTLLRFDIAVLCFAILDFVLNIPMSPSQVALSLVCWDSIGNSNWYIFIILICYGSTWLAHRIARMRSLSAYAANAFLWLALVLAMATLVTCRDSHWYNTMLAYPAGALYAQLRKRINQIFFDHFWLSSFVLSGLAIFIHVVTHYVSLPGGDVWYNLKGLSFAFLLVCVMTRLELRSRPLRWMGENLFEIYIYQRLPMIALMTLVPSAVFAHQGVFVFVSVLVTIGIVFLIRLVKGVGRSKT